MDKSWKKTAFFALVGALFFSSFHLFAEHPRQDSSKSSDLRKPSQQDSLSPRERRELRRKRQLQKRKKLIRQRRQERLNRFQQEHDYGRE